MDLISQHIEVVIIAAFGKDQTAGLPGVSTIPRIYQPHATIGNHVLASTMRTPRDLTKSPTWVAWAWTSQEALLARRRLAFKEEQVNFECWVMNCRETVDLEVDATELSLLGPKIWTTKPRSGRHSSPPNHCRLHTPKTHIRVHILNAFEGILKAYMGAEPSVVPAGVSQSFPRPSIAPITHPTH
jgi:hypothetical protein